MNRKKIGILSIVIVLLAIFTVIFYNRKTDNTFLEDGVLYAVLVDGKESTTFPKKGQYKVEVNCENGTGKWDYASWKLFLSDIQGDMTCDISFTTETIPKLSNHIIGLAGSTQGTGQVVNEKGYRYEGRNPNNYVWFNNELWRIIGVFGSSDHGKSGQNLVKIIRNDSIGNFVWDKSNNNNWSTSSIKSILNAYYNKQDATTADYCYTYATTTKGNCNFSGNGIDSTYRAMIEKATWPTGGYSNTTNPNDMYNQERGTNRYSSNPLSITEYLGLMYPSDYGYAVLASSCVRTTNIGSYSTAACAGQNWLFSKGFEWTLTTYSGGNNTYFIYNNGYYTYTSSNQGYAVRPVAYLVDSVYKFAGIGSATDPYMIGKI